MTTEITRSARRAITAGAAITLLLLGASATPAYANGSNSRLCSQATTVSGWSDTGGAHTYVPNGNCARAMARDWYQYSGGGTTYWTVWKYANVTAHAYVPAGAIGLGAQHKVETPGSGYAGNFPFNT